MNLTTLRTSRLNTVLLDKLLLNLNTGTTHTVLYDLITQQHRTVCGWHLPRGPIHFPAPSDHPPDAERQTRASTCKRCQRCLLF